MEEYNTYNLRYSADFQTLIGKNTYWVPIIELGETRYTNKEIKMLCVCTPEEKREKINTAYEAIQLFQIGNFVDKQDKQIKEVDGRKWELHKSGYSAVKSNEGGCATAAAWLAYILNGKYEEMGFLSFVRQSGNGHVMNYIRYNNYYYVIDMFSMEKEHRAKICAETGKHEDYARMQYFTGVCTRVRDLADYGKYFNRILRRNERRVLLIRELEKEIPPVSIECKEKRMIIFYPKSIQSQRLTYDLPNMEIEYEDVDVEKLKYADQEIVGSL